MLQLVFSFNVVVPKPSCFLVVALLAFPSKDAAEAWRGDPDLEPVHALRNKAGESTIVVVPTA